METVIYNAFLIFPDRVEKGSINIRDGVIFRVALGGRTAAHSGDAVLEDLRGRYLAPGFVELHTHGGGGFDFMDNTPEAIIQAARTHLRHGTTTLLPTALAADADTLKAFIAAFRQAKAQSSGVPRLPGVHMEGPYLNMAQKGAISPKYIRNPDAREYEALVEFAQGDIARWTAAPELPGALEMGDYLARRGVLPSIGHTDAEFAEVREAFAHGYTHCTHLYSAMSTIRRKQGFRTAGALESAFLLEDMTVEIIADGCHLPAELLYYVYRVKGADKTCLTCDSMRCAGLSGVTEGVLGTGEDAVRVLIEDGVAKLPDRSAFAGSIATDDRLVRVMARSAGTPLHDAVRMMTLTPARVMGWDAEIGSIKPGKKADFAVLDTELTVRRVMLGGEWIETD
ncbi:MAG: N-acetylglucosamine-6-phosphate deacetylase [Clostridiales bacterium]|jgi:N-acetylglucosamine-6-phosphate deacetylase|nr:N-acetylglucosamine-6-phosphate deacetylase [Clostridiales bacterium]